MKTSCCKGLDAIIGTGSDIVGELNLVNHDDKRFMHLGAPPGQKKTYLVMHIENPKGLVAKEKGGGVAWATDMLVPEFIENMIYSKVKDQLVDQFREKGSEISVDITQSPPQGEKPTSDLKGGILLGLLLAGLSYGAVKLAGRVRPVSR